MQLKIYKPVLLSILKVSFHSQFQSSIGTRRKMQINLSKFTFQIFEENRGRGEKEWNYSFETGSKTNLFVLEISCESKLPRRRNFIHIQKGKEGDSASCLALPSLELVLFSFGNDNKGVINKPRLRY